MKKTNFTIQFEEEKLKAARFYAERKEAGIEDEMAEYLQKLYEKYVPKDTREYLETALASAAPARPKPKPKAPVKKAVTPGGTSAAVPSAPEATGNG